MKGSIIAFDPCPHCENHDMCSKCELTFRRSGAIANPCEWISVEEGLPDMCGMDVLMVAVNCYGQTNIVKGFTDYQCPIKFLTNEKQYDNIWGAWEVTHWMPLPDAPKGGAE